MFCGDVTDTPPECLTCAAMEEHLAQRREDI
jgi:hypothetical protein